MYEHINKWNITMSPCSLASGCPSKARYSLIPLMAGQQSLYKQLKKYYMDRTRQISSEFFVVYKVNIEQTPWYHKEPLLTRKLTVYSSCYSKMHIPSTWTASLLAVRRGQLPKPSKPCAYCSTPFPH